MDAATPIGFRYGRAAQQPVCIPLDLRLQGMHIIGSSGTGKSTLVERMALHDIQQGHGVAVLDPHGGVVEGLLRSIPRCHADRVVYLNLGDPLWAPAWNPLRQRISAHPGRVVDAVTYALLPRCRFGDRPEYITRQAVLAASRLPDGNLWDAWDLLRRAKRSDKHSARLRSRVLRASGDDRLAEIFWRDAVTRYSWGELQSAVVVLHRLLASGLCSRIFSQSESSIDLYDIMESGKILLLDLSPIGSEVGNVLGALVLALLHLAAVSRQGPDDRTLSPFHIYCDEAHRFTPNGPDALMADTRRFGVSMTFTYQYMRQSDSCHADVLLNVGSTIIFRVNSDDAHELCKGLQGKVTVDDLVTLDSGLAVARIAGKVVRLRTLPMLEIPTDNCRDLIVQQCHEQYYRPVR